MMGAVDRLRVVLLGYVVGFPLGGMTWHSLQYAMGLDALGHDVWVLEDSDDYETCYDPSTGESGTDPSYGLAYAADVFDRVGLGDRWVYHHAHSSAWHGPAAEGIGGICRDADVVINLAGIHPLRPWLEGVPVRIYIDADPAFTQIRHLTDPRARDLAERHTAFFSFGEGIEQGTAEVPDDGLPWKATRQPIAVDAWPVTPARPGAPFTTVMQWDSYGSHEYGGRRYGMKSTSFDPYLRLPEATRAPLELAVGKLDPGARERLGEAGWRLADPQVVTRTPWTYQDYIGSSIGEFAVAKQGYVVSRSGWFSERSACYLASGRPAVVQDTGFSTLVPTGEGLLAFSTPEDARVAIERVRSDPLRHGRTAREIAEECFGAERVLSDLLERATG